MIESSLSNAAEYIHGQLLGSDVRFRGVSTDTRTLQAGQLFVALQGPNFDGNKFVADAAKRDAAAAVVSSPVDAGIPRITVADTKLALGQLAAAWRRQMPATIIGITGSNGKTTLKELVASCLSQAASTLATQGNLNNDIGLPLMLLRLDKEHCFGVMEMGANHAGEIAYLASLATPSVVAITNAGPAHLEGFGSIAGVAAAKGEILNSEYRPETVVLNADDDYFDYWMSLAHGSSLISFGFSSDAMVRATNIVATAGGSTFDMSTPAGNTTVNLPLRGVHNVRNACAAAAISIAVDVPLYKINIGLESVAPVNARLSPIKGIRGSRIFDDSYNANPASAIAAAEFLAALDGDSLLVLADMGELGSQAPELHYGVGVAAKAAGIKTLFATGELSKNTVEGFGAGATWFQSTDDVITELRTRLSRHNNVLVKGSRSMRMERVVLAIQDVPNKAGSA